MRYAPWVALNGVEVSQALTAVIGDSKWEVVALAHAFLARAGGKSLDEAAAVGRSKKLTLARCRALLQRCEEEGFQSALAPRPQGSAENPVTKLIPALLTEKRFIERLQTLKAQRPGLDYSDDRIRHDPTDVVLIEGERRLPINIKVASTRFEMAKKLVGLDPDDCIPIATYKAHAALARHPTLLYVVAIDFTLNSVAEKLVSSLEPAEATAWDAVNRYVGLSDTGAGVGRKDAEDSLVKRIVERHWERIRSSLAQSEFHVVSARRVTRILQTKPERTPGIGIKAWGTRASAELNVHLSVRDETTPWTNVASRIASGGLEVVLESIARTKTEVVPDPEI